MPQEKKKNSRIEILISIAGILGAVLFFTLYDQVFPSAALNLALSREEIGVLAQETLQDYGYDLDGYEFALTFERDSMASIYLQRILGIPKTNQLIQSEDIPIWYWRARWFRPLEKEEFRLGLSADGNVIGFSHSIEEDTPGAELSEKSARSLAEAYLIEEHDWLKSEWEEISASSEAKPGGRVDHYYEWKQRHFEIGESQLRIAVSIQGDVIGGYEYWLRVPEAFLRQFSVQNNRAGFIAGINVFIGMVVFGLSAAFMGFVSLFYHYRPRIRDVVLVAFIAGVALLASLNMLPLDKINYSTTQEYSQFWLMQITSSLFSALGMASYIFLTWWGGVRLGKLVWQRQDKILPERGNQWVNLSRSSWRGLMLGGLMGAYVVIFYLIATQLFGGWVPIDVDYSNLYATPMPFLGPIQMGLQPAVMEETIFRLIGIALILGISKRRWLALLIPGLVWGFAHLSYVREPYYLRGIELSISAIFLLGLFFWHFDLTTTIVGHMAYNATLGMLPLLRSGEPYFVISGVIVALFLVSPMLPGLVILTRSRLSGIPYEPDPPEIIQAAPSDLEGLRQLEMDEVDWENLLADQQAVVYGLKSNTELVGVAIGRMEGSKGYLESVYVAKEWRYQYWGNQLADTVSQALEDCGAETIQAQASIHNRSALAFLAGMGWNAETQIYTMSAKPTLKSFWKRIAFRRPRLKDWFSRKKK